MRGPSPPAGGLEITGRHLKIHDNLEEEGVFFVSQSDDTDQLLPC